MKKSKTLLLRQIIENGNCSRRMAGSACTKKDKLRRGARNMKDEQQSIFVIEKRQIFGKEDLIFGILRVETRAPYVNHVSGSRKQALRVN